MENLLKVDDLKTYFKTHIGDVQAVRGISLYFSGSYDFVKSTVYNW